MYPHFLGIGAQKAGTTWLYQSLSRHPEIWMPKEKELHYFDEKRGSTRSVLELMRGSSGEAERWRRQLRRRRQAYIHDLPRVDYRQLLWDTRYYFGRPGDDWYAKLFEPGQGKICGEITPDYSVLKDPEVEAISQIMPGLRSILIVRNPIERAWSHAHMELVRVGRRPVGEIGRDEFRAHFTSRRSRRFSDYLKTRRVWSRHFPAGQLFVGFLEDIAFHPRRMLKRVLGFLGASTADPDQIPGGKVHTGHYEMMPTWAARDLAEIYHEDLEILARRLGWHAEAWLEMAEELLESRVEAEELRYPLWESDLEAAQRYQGEGKDIRLVSSPFA